MKRLVVLLKQSVDVSQVKVDPATRQLITAGAPKKISDFDKNALEEAIRTKEKLGNLEVVTLTVDPEDAKPVLREALAMGADKSYLISDPAVSTLDTSGTAYIMVQALKKIGEFDLILGGDTSLDSFSGLVGPRLAENLGLPHISSVRKLSVDSDYVVAERALEESSETVKAKLPAIVTVTREINQPRIPSLMMIMKASKKEIVKWALGDIEVNKDNIASKIEVIEALAPKMERKKIIIKGETTQEIAEKLAKALIQEGVVGR